jgi:hypothetical protein
MRLRDRSLLGRRRAKWQREFRRLGRKRKDRGKAKRFLELLELHREWDLTIRLIRCNEAAKWAHYNRIYGHGWATW